MATRTDEAIEALYRAPLASFVAERKRLAAELKATGDKEGAARLAKLGRPSISAWAVNQLWWHHREAFERLLGAAAGLRTGQRDATGAHREALTALRARAGSLLTDAGHAAPESTLRRVTMTLSALAALGGFEPDPPGALAADRDPPGFEALDLGAVGPAPTKDARDEPARLETKPAEGKSKADAEEVRQRAKKEAEQRAAEQRAAEQKEAERRRRLEEERAEQARRELERARKEAERQRLQASLLAAKTELEQRASDTERLRRDLLLAEDLAEKARTTIRNLEKELAALTIS